MRVVLVVLYVGLVWADEPSKIAAEGSSREPEPAASEESQWEPFFSEASRASEGLPWGSVAPELAQDSQSASSNDHKSYPYLKSTPHHQPFDYGDASLGSSSEERKDVHKVTITKKVRVPYTVHVEKHIPKIIEVPVDKPFNVYVPKPYPVIVEKKVPYEIKVPQPQPYTVEKRVPYPVKVLVDKPYTVHVPKPYPVDVEKKYQFTVEKKIPYEVKVPVERPYPVHVLVEKEVKFPVETKVPIPVKVPYEKPIPIHVTKHIPVNVDKPVPYTVEKVATYPVKVPFRIPIKVHYPEGGSLDDSQVNAQNSDWTEAMNKAIRLVGLESRPSQGYGSLELSQSQGDSHGPNGQVESQKQGQSEYQIPSQWHQEPQRLPQFHTESQRPSHSQKLSPRPTIIRQGFSIGRGLPTRNGYLLGKHLYKRPTTKLQPVAHQYEVIEPQQEQPFTGPFLNSPVSKVIVPQMILATPPPDSAELEHSASPNGGLQQSNSLSSSLQESNHLQSGSYHSSSQNNGLPQSNYQSSVFQANPLANSNRGSQQGSIPLGFKNSISPWVFKRSVVNNQQFSFVDHQNNKNGTPSFSITNVIHHTGTPSQQTPIHHPGSDVISGIPHHSQSAQLPEYLIHNMLGSESPRLPSAIIFKPAQNKSTPMYGTKTSISSPPSPQNSPQTPFVTSGFTISFQSPPSAQNQPTSSPKQARTSQLSLASPQPGRSPQLSNPTGNPAPQNIDHVVSSSFIGSKTVREGQELTYSTSVHHSPVSPNKRPE